MASKPKSAAQLIAEVSPETAKNGDIFHSETLATALVKAQSMMAHAHLDGVNPHFKSKYSTLQSVIDAVKPSLNACGIAFVQRAHSADGGVSVETVFIHESGEQLSCGEVFVPVDKRNAHGTGSAYTYAKRYALAMACGIGADEDDDGNTAAENAPNKGVMGAVMPDVKSDDAKALKAAERLDGMFALNGEGRNAQIELASSEEELQQALEWINGQGQDFKIAVWNKLGSKIRSYISAMEKS